MEFFLDDEKFFGFVSEDGEARVISSSFRESATEYYMIYKGKGYRFASEDPDDEIQSHYEVSKEKNEIRYIFVMKRFLHIGPAFPNNRKHDLGVLQNRFQSLEEQEEVIGLIKDFLHCQYKSSFAAFSAGLEPDYSISTEILWSSELKEKLDRGRFIDGRSVRF